MDSGGHDADDRIANYQGLTKPARFHEYEISNFNKRLVATLG